MIYGRTNLNQEWELKEDGEELLYNENNKVLSIPGLIGNLNIEPDEKLFFYVFSYRKEERFVFITKKQVCFRQLSSPLPRSLGEYAILVNGVLYDVEKKSFVFDTDGSFHCFIIYDCGVPNVIYDEKSGKHIVFALNDKEYSFFTVRRRHQPTFVSHLWKKGRIGRPINNRLIFFTPVGEDEENMLILHEEIEIEALYKNVQFVETIPLNDEDDSAVSYFRSVHGKDGKDVSICQDVKGYHSKLLTFDDAVSVEQPTGEYNIMFVEGGHFVYAEAFDCYNYKKVRNFDGSPCQDNRIRVCFRKNDFENCTSIFNVTTGKNV